MSEKAERCPGNCCGGLVEVEWWDDWGDKWMPCPVCGYEDDEGVKEPTHAADTLPHGKDILKAIRGNREP